MGSVALIKDGLVIYANQLGYADIDSKQKPNGDTKYRIGSITKTFTAVLVFKCIEEGKLSLSQSINDYFPDIENAKKITIGNLLNHRSGIHNFTNDNEYLRYNTQPKTEKEMVDIIIEGGTDFQPDEKAQYSNSNYVLLSYVLEEIYKTPYSEMLKEMLLIL